MDIAAIRRGLTDAAVNLDCSVYAYPPDDLEDPALVIGLPQQVLPNRTLGVDQLDIRVTYYAARVDNQDALAKLDTALSTGVNGSIIDVLRSATSSAWRGKPLVPLASAIREVAVGDVVYLAADLTLQIIA